MNKSTTQRSEEARRQATAALTEAKRQQNALLRERARVFASETQKIENLRALRLAKMDSDKIAATATDVTVEARSVAKRRRMPAAA